MTDKPKKTAKVVSIKNRRLSDDLEYFVEKMNALDEFKDDITTAATILVTEAKEQGYDIKRLLKAVEQRKSQRPADNPLVLNIENHTKFQSFVVRIERLKAEKNHIVDSRNIVIKRMIDRGHNVRLLLNANDMFNAKMRELND